MGVPLPSSFFRCDGPESHVTAEASAESRAADHGSSLTRGETLEDVQGVKSKDGTQFRRFFENPTEFRGDSSAEMRLPYAGDDMEAREQERESIPRCEAMTRADCVLHIESLSRGEAQAQRIREGSEGTRGIGDGHDGKISSLSCFSEPPLTVSPAPAAGSGESRSLAFVGALKAHGTAVFFTFTRWHLLVLLCLYSVLVGPVYLNWAPFRQMLFDHGVYRWLCNPAESDASQISYIDPQSYTCAQQRLHVGHLFTLCTVADYGMSFFGGFVMDFAGPKVASLSGTLMMVLGWLLLAFSSEAFQAFEVGVVFFGLGIDMAFYGTLPIGSLFPGHGNTVRALLVAMRSVSYVTPVILQKAAAAWSISYKSIMIGYAAAAFAPALLIACLFSPWAPWDAKGTPADEAQDERGASQRRNQHMQEGTKNTATPAFALSRGKNETAGKRSRFSPLFSLFLSAKSDRQNGERDMPDAGVSALTSSPPSMKTKILDLLKMTRVRDGKVLAHGGNDDISGITPTTGDHTATALKHPSADTKDGFSGPAAVPTDTGSLAVISLSSSSPKHYSEDAEKPTPYFHPEHSLTSSLQPYNASILEEDPLVSSVCPCAETASPQSLFPHDELSVCTPQAGDCTSPLPHPPSSALTKAWGADERDGSRRGKTRIDAGREGGEEQGVAPAFSGHSESMKPKILGTETWRNKLRAASRGALSFTKDYLCSGLYFPIIPYFTITLVRAVYFNTASHDLVPHALSFLHIIVGFVCFFPPVAGFIADRYGILLCMALINACGTLVILLSLVTLLLPGMFVWLEYVISVFFMLNMSLMTNQIYFYVGAIFPQRHLGKLIGFTCTVGGLLSLLASPMFDFSVKSGTHGFMGVLTLLAVLSGVTFLLLLALHVFKKRRDRKSRSSDKANPCTAVLAL
ncbi:hypothetical protein BESB_056080 [Besnoitia besnoiti]|uniref:Uncharacterized protein n=1 Tax=Besnoitia besnoiti TaxID=94643 RepID=A0A2A9MK28_BESBE|nr:hypothetical protein BESB_056080 [Besnoitia besnoiti]PFH35957.1 hypothetical protein BESB_056080 [Besnoitia besnoiti]